MILQLVFLLCLHKHRISICKVNPKLFSPTIKKSDSKNTNPSVNHFIEYPPQLFDTIEFKGHVQQPIPITNSIFISTKMPQICFQHFIRIMDTELTEPKQRTELQTVKKKLLIMVFLEFNCTCQILKFDLLFRH